MKILHIIPTLSKGGAERLVLTICNELQKREAVEVRLVTFSDTNEYGDIVNTIQWDVVPSTFVPSFSGKSKKYIVALQAYITAYAPNVIHTHLWEAEMVSRQITYPNAIWVSHMHDNMPQLQRIRIPITKKELANSYERWILLQKYKALKNRFIAISNDTYLYTYKNLPNSLKQNVIQIYNAIEVARFSKPQNLSRNQNGKLQLVTVGSLVNKKNQIFLIPVIQYIMQKGIECELHILGEGINRNAIQTEISKYNLQASIFLHGNVSVEEYYWNADIYLHSATYEPFGLVLIEAMAAGLPVVTLDGKGNRDLIDQGKNGYMVFDQNSELFAKKILEIWNDKKLYASMSMHAVEFAKQYDIKEYVDRLLQIYNS